MADEMQVNRDIVIEVDAESIERLRKEGHVRGSRFFATSSNAPVATTRRRRRWAISLCRWPFDCSPKFPGTGK
jgi:hypothetical protein